MVRPGSQRPPVPPEVNLENMARAMEAIASIVQQQHQAAAAHGTAEYQGLSEFRRNDPPQYAGAGAPDRADYWIREIEKIFRAMDCPDERKVSYSTFMLTGEAEIWWQGVQATYAARGEMLSWDLFKGLFLNKFFPPSAKLEKEREFTSLQQGGMSIYQYAAKFEHLVRFYSLPTTEAWRCQKFEEGLRLDIQEIVVPLGITEFAPLVEKARTVEKLKEKSRSLKMQSGSTSTSSSGKRPFQRPVQRRPFQPYPSF